MYNCYVNNFEFFTQYNLTLRALKRPGDDNILLISLIDSRYIIYRPLRIVRNTSMHSDSFPTRWESSLITSQFKSDE